MTTDRGVDHPVRELLAGRRAEAFGGEAELSV